MTLIGPFGVGKSQIAHHHCQTHARPRRLLRCDLAASTGEHELLAAVAHCLGVPVATDPPTTVGVIGRALAARGPGTQLVLDNADLVVEPLAAALNSWLAAASSASFLVTSRRPLGLQREQCLRISPLSQADGVALFRSRMAATGEAAALVDIDRASIAEIVRSLDGIPLALEMAAARTSVLQPAELLRRLGARLELLRSDRRDAPAHHATLAISIARSWDLLTPCEAEVLGQCSLFVDTFTLAAAEATLAPTTPNAPSLVDILQRLVEHSLLYPASPDPDGREARIGVHQSVRAFAARQVAPSELAAAARRHARFHLAWAEPLADSLERGYSRAALDRLAREFTSLAGIADSRANAPELACRAALALDALLIRRGPLSLRLQLLQACVASSAGLPRALQVRMLHAFARALADHGRPLAAIEALELALGLARADDDAHTAQHLLRLLVDLHRACGRFARAIEYAVEARGPTRPSDGDPPVTSSRDWLDSREDRTPPASRGVRRLLALALDHLGPRALFQGDLREALADFQEARRLASGCEDTSGELRMRWLVAAATHALGDTAEAARLYDAVATQLESGGYHRYLALVLALAGTLHLAEWRIAEARALLERSRIVAAATAAIYPEALALAGLAALEAIVGRRSIAGVHLATARTLAAAIDSAGLALSLGPGVELLAAVVELGHERGLAGNDDPARPLDRRGVEPYLARLRELRREGDFHVIILGRILERAALAGDPETSPTPRPGRPPIAVPPSPASLEVAPDGSWFRVGRGHPVALGRHLVLRRLLLALATYSADQPGQPMPAARLIAAVWPDERIEAKAALNRLHNAIAVLRGKGLRGILRTTDEGYLLDSLVAAPALELGPRAPC